MKTSVSRKWLQRRTFVSLSAIAVFTSLAGAAQAVTVDDLQALTYPDGNGHTLPYRLFIPKGYDAAKKFRLVLFFHGAGERGNDNRNQLAGQTAPLCSPTTPTRRSGRSSWSRLSVPEISSGPIWRGAKRRA